MANRFVEVVITRQTKAVSQKGFGLPLILSTDKVSPYTEYTDASQIGVEYGADSETYKLATKVFGQTPKVAVVAVYGISYDEPTDGPTKLVSALNTLIQTENDFFYVVSTEQGDDEIKALAAWTGTQKKFYFYSTSNPLLPGLITTENALGLVHDHPETYPAEAWVGAIAPLSIGSFTATFKALNGILPASYDTTLINNIEEVNGNTYIREGGVNITSTSKTGSGEYFDIIQGQYYIEARMTENIFGMLVRLPKLPYTFEGIAQAVAEIEKTLNEATRMGIIARDENNVPLFNITVPNMDEISTNDKANRVLPDIPWTATIAGAIEKVKINGVLKL